MNELYTKVVGVTFEDAQITISKLKIVSPVWLHPEPLNPFDRFAVAVMVEVLGEEKRIGYLSKELAKELSPLIQGEKFYSTKIASITGGDKGVYGVNILIQAKGGV